MDKFSFIDKHTHTTSLCCPYFFCFTSERKTSSEPDQVWEPTFENNCSRQHLDWTLESTLSPSHCALHPKYCTTGSTLGNSKSLVEWVSVSTQRRRPQEREKSRSENIPKPHSTPQPGTWRGSWPRIRSTRLHFQQSKPASWECTCAVAGALRRGGPALGLMIRVHCLEILDNFWRAPECLHCDTLWSCLQDNPWVLVSWRLSFRAPGQTDT